MPHSHLGIAQPRKNFLAWPVTKRKIVNIWHFQSLEKRRRELAKALDDNERMIEATVTRGRSDKELKLEVDIDKLARVRVNE